MKYESVQQAREALKKLEQTQAAYNHALGVLYLDATTAAPSDTWEGRGKTMEVMSQITYDLLVNDENDELLSYLEAHADELDAQTKREVEVLRKSYDQIHRIPAEEYVAYSVLINDAESVWHKAKPEDDFAAFAPYLEKIVDYNRKFAGYYHPEMAPYDALLNEYEEGMNVQTLDAFLASVQHADIFSVGLNCSFGARQLKPFLEQLAARAPYYISAYPNAGLPNSLGQYDQTPDDMAREVAEYVREGLVNIIGGCCGTTEEYIARFPALVEGAAPHTPAPAPENLWLSGLELLEVKPENNFVNVGERCNVAGSRKFLRLINEKNYEEALSIARRQVEDGAQVIDINMDDGLLDAKEEMTTFLNLIASEPEIARVPVMIEVGRHRGRTEVCAGQGHRQLHLAEGRRGEVPGTCPPHPPPGRRCGGDGF